MARLHYHRGMSSQATDLFLHSLTRCLAVPAFLEDFYDRFVGSSEEVREKFRGVDLKRQVRMLQDSLYVVAVAAQGEEGSPARNALPWLAARHSRHDLDIRPELYDLWIDCLLETARAHDPEFGREVESAWRETLTIGAHYMRERY
jgi:hemoglobin-like flavoprotein